MYIYALIHLLHVYIFFSHALLPSFLLPLFLPLSLSLSQELSSLYQLTSLQSLSLCDPLYPPSSLCRLCNYSTLILYHMPWLKWLDSRDVDSVELRDLIKVRRRVEEREDKGRGKYGAYAFIHVHVDLCTAAVCISRKDFGFHFSANFEPIQCIHVCCIKLKSIMKHF